MAMQRRSYAFQLYKSGKIYFSFSYIRETMTLFRESKRVCNCGFSLDILHYSNLKKYDRVIVHNGFVGY